MIIYTRYLPRDIKINNDVYVAVKELKGIYKVCFNVRVHEIDDEVPFCMEIDELEDLAKELRVKIQKDIAEQEIKHLKVSSTKQQGDDTI